MSRPRLLDLFCGAGGSAMGYYQAGFDIVGVDKEPQPRFPFTFVQSDMFEYLETHDLSQFAVIHSSPPCQHYTSMLNHGMTDRANHPDLLSIVRKHLQASGLPYVIENVIGAPIEQGVMLCGAMFGLRVYRHRWFESNMFIFEPYHPRHVARIPHAGNIPTADQFYCPVGHLGDKAGSQRAMGIDWMHTQRDIAQAIPPAYTKYIGGFLLDAVQAERQVAV